MASSIEYRRYMDECLRAAAKARSDEERRSLLQLAQTWHEAINLEASAELVKQNVTVSAPHTQQAQERELLCRSQGRPNKPRLCALVHCAGCERSRTAPSPPPGRCRPHAQQSAPLTGSSEMMARSAHLMASRVCINQLPWLARAASNPLIRSSTTLGS